MQKKSEGHVGHMQAPHCRLESLEASGWHAIPTLPIQSLFKIGLILILVVNIIFYLFIKFSFIYMCVCVFSYYFVLS
jgi:hypothetical protein